MGIFLTDTKMSGSSSHKQTGGSGGPATHNTYQFKPGSGELGIDFRLALLDTLTLMPASEVPGFNSLRVQKAYRINGIETGRLDKQLQLLDRQKTHSIRLVNNDIRLTRIALEHIETSSGHSAQQEGFFGADATEGSSEFAAFEAGSKPMFLYGERKVSRRVGKFRRIQSAVVKGRATSASSKLNEASQLNRPKSSIPTFSEIKERVTRQMEVNPDWDPNTELPYIPLKEESSDPNIIRNNWVLVSNPNTPATRTRPGRNKSGKNLNVSWQQLNKPSSPASEQGERDPSSEVITMIGKENMDQKVKPEKKLRKVGIITHRSKSAKLAKEESKEQDSSSVTGSQCSKDEQENSEELTERLKQTRSAGGRLERNKVLPKQRNPRDHPVAKLVGKTREMIGKAKKAQHSSSYYDPEKSELGSNRAWQKRNQAEKLSRNKSKQEIANISTDEKVIDYLNRNPPGKHEEIANPVTQYDLMKEAQKLKHNDALFDLKEFEEVELNY